MEGEFIPDPDLLLELGRNCKGTVCATCSTIKENTDNFCPGCGDPNEYFNLGVFCARNIKLYADRNEVAASCDTELHAMILKSYITEKGIYPADDRKSFCPNCGAPLT